ncbi:MAG: hypothetical protein R3B46_07825 [Phycisphaerales bacterium]
MDERGARDCGNRSCGGRGGCVRVRVRGGVAGRDDAAVRGEIGSVGGAVVVDDGEAERVVVRSLNRARAGVAMVARYMLAFADVASGGARGWGRMGVQ